MSCVRVCESVIIYIKKQKIQNIKHIEKNKYKKMTYMMTPPRGVGRTTVCKSAKRPSHRISMDARVVKGADLRPADYGRVGSNPTPCTNAPIAQLVRA